MTAIIAGNTRRQLMAYVEVLLGSRHRQLEVTHLAFLDQGRAAPGNGDFDDRDANPQPGTMAMLCTASIDRSRS